MTLAVSQPYFFPYIGYFQLIHAADRFILYDHLNFIKGGWINRNRIVVPGAGDVYIRISLNKKSPNKYIDELTINYKQDWQGKMVKQLQCAYGRYPFFKEVFPFLSELLMRKYAMLTDFNCHTITAIADLLDIKTEIVCGSGNYLEIERELEAGAYLYEKKVQRIFSICRQEKADTYVNAIGGRSLYSKEVFKANGIRLSFVKTHESVSDKSIIDVLFRYGTNKAKELLNDYELI